MQQEERTDRQFSVDQVKGEGDVRDADLAGDLSLEQVCSRAGLARTIDRWAPAHTHGN
jgi:hypothetical protein